MHSVSEFKNSNIANKNYGGAVATIILTAAMVAGCFYRIASIL